MAAHNEITSKGSPGSAPSRAPGATAAAGPTSRLVDWRLLKEAGLDSLRKLDPRVQLRNPVMFVVWVGAAC